MATFLGVNFPLNKTDKKISSKKKVLHTYYFH